MRSRSFPPASPSPPRPLESPSSSSLPHLDQLAADLAQALQDLAASREELAAMASGPFRLRQGGDPDAGTSVTDGKSQECSGAVQGGEQQQGFFKELQEEKEGQTSQRSLLSLMQRQQQHIMSLVNEVNGTSRGKGGVNVINALPQWAGRFTVLL